MATVMHSKDSWFEPHIKLVTGGHPVALIVYFSRVNALVLRSLTCTNERLFVEFVNFKMALMYQALRYLL